MRQSLFVDLKFLIIIYKYYNKSKKKWDVG